MTSPGQIVRLAREILANATAIENYCSTNNVQPPSFAPDGPPAFQIPPSQPEAAKAQVDLLTKTMELHHLVSGPIAMLMSTGLEDAISMHAIYRFGIAKAVPATGDISFEDLSKACKLNLVDLRRIVRQAMTRHTFSETRPGYVAHTAASKVLAENPLVESFVGMEYEEKFKASAFVTDALSTYNGAQDASETGFSLGHGTKKGLYDELQDHPARAHRWTNGMSQFASRIPLDPLINGFDWKGLGKATVVDVGGCHGPVSIGLAQQFPDLHFIVQDLPDVVSPKPQISPELSDRIEFMAHDFRLEQPVKGAAAYFFRAVFHNWPDAQCIIALRNHARVMGENSLLIINESLLHQPGSVPAFLDKRKRNMDLSMLAYFGSRERDENDYRELLTAADPRLELRSVSLPATGANHILVVGIKAG